MNSTRSFSILGLVMLGLMTGLGACGITADMPSVAPPASDLIHAAPWPEADALFRSDLRWLGADDAYSIDLGGGRVLWLFADTFVSMKGQGWPRILPARRTSTMIRNSVGIQSGYDPSAAAIEFHWRTEDGKPRSFFPEEGETWFWPGHGLVLDDVLLLFFMATHASSGGLGFEHTGWRAVRVLNFEQAPSEWRLEWLDTSENRFGLIVSGGVLRIGDHVYAFSVREPEHTVHLVRWPVTRAKVGDLLQPQWWDGTDKGWVPEQDLTRSPQALFSEGHTEFTVHHEPALDRFLEIQTVGFGPADLGFRLAETPAGEWTPIERFYRPQEYETPNILIYAAKAHPHLSGADLVLTYATNTYPFSRLIRSDELYYPRFLRADLKECK